MHDFSKLKKKLQKDEFESFEKIYNILEDNKSKNIFYYRILFDIERSNYNLLKLCQAMYFDNSIYNKSDMMYKRIIDYLLEDNNYEKDIYVYGYVKPIINFLENFNIREIYPQSIFKVIFSKINIKEKFLLVFEKFRYIKQKNRINRKKNSSEVINIVLDNRKIKSENTLYANYGTFVYNEYIKGIQYFGESFLKFDDHEVFVDGGAYYLETSKEFSYIVNGKYKMIYAFEPYKKIYESIENNLNNIKIFNKGLYNKTTTKKFSASLNGDSRICESGSETIDLVDLDSLNIDATIVKLDIEGAELEALDGMKKTIKRCRPKLLISGYHKKLDTINIINKVLDIDNTYKVYIRHYNYNECETVIYFI